ncbi:MAG: DinB family protein [Ferruginibacter sp.]
MKELLQQYASFNIWATNILFERITKIPEEKITQEIVSSFPSVYKTALHLWQAESIWWQRINKAEKIIVLSETFTGSFNELKEGIAQQSRQWKKYVDAIAAEGLNETFSFVRNGQPFTMIVHDMLLHLFNHATFHRGQLVTLLRQLGEVTDIPSTDFSTYTRIEK